MHGGEQSLPRGSIQHSEASMSFEILFKRMTKHVERHCRLLDASWSPHVPDSNGWQLIYSIIERIKLQLSACGSGFDGWECMGGWRVDPIDSCRRGKDCTVDRNRSMLDP